MSNSKENNYVDFESLQKMLGLNDNDFIFKLFKRSI